MRPEVNKTRLTVLIALMFSALCAGVFRTPPILFMAALLTSAPFVGILVGSLSSRGLRLERRLPESGTVGDIVSGEIALANANRWPVFLVHTRCGEGMAKAAALTKRRAKKGAAFDSAAENSQAIVAAGEDERVVPLLRSRERMVWKQQWLLQRRGVHMLGAARAGALDPLGLYNRMPAHSETRQIVVLPRPIKVDQLGFLSGEGASSQTPRRSTAVADAMDFHGVRQWQPGEAIRRAHWKNTARTGNLHVIEWEETPTADLAIFLDTHAATIGGEGAHDTLESAITTAASVACHLLENGCRVQLFFYTHDNTRGESEKNAAAGKERHNSDDKARPTLQRLEARSVDKTGAFLRALAEIEPVHEPSGGLSHLMDEALPKMARGMGVLVLASVRADIAAALARAKTGGVHCHALAFEFSALPAAPTWSTPEAAANISQANISQANISQASTPGAMPRAPVNTAGSTPGPERGIESAVQAAMPTAKALHHTATRSVTRGKDIQIIRSDDVLAAALERRW